MAFCQNCGTSVADNIAFCPNCGTSLQPPAATAGFTPSYESGSAVIPVPQPEEKGRRVLAYLIDVIPMLLLALIHFVPVIGWMFYGLLHALYWLLRDINGASPGKSILGSYVVSENGAPSTTSQRILRNVSLAIPGLIGMIPFIGIIFEFVLALIIFGGEAILLLATGRRLGDRLAGTNVYRK